MNAITEAKDLMTLPMDELLGNLQTYELNRTQGGTRKESKKEKNIALKSSQSEMTEEEAEMVYVTKRFQKVIKKYEGFQNKGSTSRVAITNDLCHKCRKPSHFMRECLSQKQESLEVRYPKMVLVPNNFQRKAHADQVVKRAFVV